MHSFLEGERGKRLDTLGAIIVAVLVVFVLAFFGIAATFVNH